MGLILMRRPCVHHTFQELADQVVASLLGDVGQSTALEQASKKSR